MNQSDKFALRNTNHGIVPSYEDNVGCIELGDFNINVTLLIYVSRCCVSAPLIMFHLNTLHCTQLIPKIIAGTS